MPISNSWQTLAILLASLAFSLCGGCASGPANGPVNPDPWQKTNRFFYDVNDGIDRVALKPLSDGYVKIIPKPIRTGIGNGFDNLSYFNVIANDLLQTKWNQGLGDAGRMAVNSTVGIAGFFDVATGWGMPSHDNDFGTTLAKWGAGPGPYLVLPLFGPSTLRDAPGIAVEYVCTPTTWLSLPLYISAPLYVVDTVDLRSRLEITVRFRNNTALDPYIFTRDAYLQYREAKVHDGKLPPTSNQSIYDDDSDTGPTSAPAATQPQTKPTTLSTAPTVRAN